MKKWEQEFLRHEVPSFLAKEREKEAQECIWEDEFLRNEVPGFIAAQEEAQDLVSRI